MADKTITMSLSEYENWDKNKKSIEEALDQAIDEIYKLRQAKLVVVDKRTSEYKESSVITYRIYGRGVELNKFIKALRDDYDNLYIKMQETNESYDYILQRRLKEKKSLNEKLETFKSKWWYKLFSKF